MRPVLDRVIPSVLPYRAVTQCFTKRSSSMDKARFEVPAPTSETDFSLTVKRNCSVSPRTLLWLLAATALLSFGIGLGFALFGAWWILPFAGIEMAGLTYAFYISGRHAADYERIVRSGATVMVEICDAERVDLYRFNPHWLKVIAREAPNGIRLALAQHGKELEIGRHLDASRRRDLAAELRARFSANAT